MEDDPTKPEVIVVSLEEITPPESNLDYMFAFVDGANELRGYEIWLDLLRELSYREVIKFSFWHLNAQEAKEVQNKQDSFITLDQIREVRHGVALRKAAELRRQAERLEEEAQEILEESGRGPDDD